MPKLIHSYQIGPAIVDAIKDSKSKCILVSPFVKFWGHLRTELERAIERQVEVIFYMRKPDPNYSNDVEKVERAVVDIQAIGGDIRLVSDLHAKVYIFDAVSYTHLTLPTN